MSRIYQIIKSFLASADMVHVWLSFVLTIVFACMFRLMGTADKWQIILVSGLLAFFVGVFVESFDGYFGTRQYDKTGVKGNEFSPQDLLRDGIGCVAGMVAIAIMIL